MKAAKAGERRKFAGLLPSKESAHMSESFAWNLRLRFVHKFLKFQQKDRHNYFRTRYNFVFFIYFLFF